MCRRLKWVATVAICLVADDCPDLIQQFALRERKTVLYAVDRHRTICPPSIGFDCQHNEHSALDDSSRRRSGPLASNRTRLSDVARPHSLALCWMFEAFCSAARLHVRRLACQQHVRRVRRTMDRCSTRACRQDDESIVTFVLPNLRQLHALRLPRQQRADAADRAGDARRRSTPAPTSAGPCTATKR